MKSVRPSQHPPPQEEALSEEEGLVLAQVDQRRSVREIADMLGAPEERVEVIIDGLAQQGLVAVIPSDEPLSRAALPAADESGAYTYSALGEPVAEDLPTGPLFDEELPQETENGSFEDGEGSGESAEDGAYAVYAHDSIPAEEPGYADPDQPAYEEPADSLSDMASYDPMEHLSTSVPPPADTTPGLPDDGDLESGEIETLGPSDVVDGEMLDPDASAPSPDPIAQQTAEEKAEEEAAANNERNYRKIFETKFHKLLPDARIALASKVTGTDLLALCLDPDPKVISAIMSNSMFALDHARLIAFYHRTGAGLDMLASRVELVRDGLVFRRLIRNTSLGAATLRRVLQPRRLIEIYKVAIDHDIPELSRQNSRGLLRAKFTSQAAPEERAELIVNTEARVLMQLTGCTIDSRTTQILCGRQVYSALFVQNIARFAAAPPALLGHLAKLPFVRRNPGLKKILMQHPNMPGDVKRSM